MHKVIHSALNLKGAKTYVPYQVFESEQMLHDLLIQPDDFLDHLRRYTYAVTAQVTYGFRASAIDDENLQKLYLGMRNFSHALGTLIAGLLDLFPILRQLPDALLPLRKKAQELHAIEMALYMGHWITSKNQIKKGTAKVSVSV